MKKKASSKSSRPRPSAAKSTAKKASRRSAPAPSLADVRTLAKLHGVDHAYTSAAGVRVVASLASLQRALGALGVSADTAAQVRTSIRDTLKADKLRIVEPVTVAWHGSKSHVVIHPRRATDAVECELRLENGESHRWTVKAAARKGRDGKLSVKASLPADLPMGYHTLIVRVGRGKTAVKATSRVICAPERSYQPESESSGESTKLWGLFVPLYALRSTRDLGCGDLSELRELTRWAGGLGARVFGTLPTLAAFLDEPFDPSPYAPVSRLFWNELFADITRAPEFASVNNNGSENGLLRSGAARREVGDLRALDRVDYKRQAALVRPVLEQLAQRFFENKGDKSEAYQAFLRQMPEAEDYAKFRAVCDRQRTTWDRWPARLRDGQIRSSDYDVSAYRRHLYGQFLFESQLDECIDDMHTRGQTPYLDLPVGVHPMGYDAWKRRECFAKGCSTGAPPDPYFTTGQNWGFPPLHPRAVRDDGYEYVIASLRHHMRHAGMLRMDHVMAMHRLFWIPQGMSAAEGVYVNYHPDEQWAVLSLESHRNKCRVIGENLGTVPQAVNDRMVRHAVGQLYVVQYELNPSANPALREPPSNCAASLNTHDMAMFTHYWALGDIADRATLGMLDSRTQAAEIEGRTQVKRSLTRMLASKGLLPSSTSTDDADASVIISALLRLLASSDAELLLINLEDLWGETHWQNIPATLHEHANWQHKLARDLDEIRGDAPLNTLLRTIDALRARRPSDHRPVKKSGSSRTHELAEA